MTTQEFFNKWNGKLLDYDGSFGGQCVDVYRQYCKEVLNVPQSPPVVGAADIWTSYLKEYFNRIDNTPEGVPQKGDIMIWNKFAGGGFGHVAIFSEGNVNTFTSFDENWPVGSICHFQPHNYINVSGWLRPKTTPQPSPEPQGQPIITESTKIPQIVDEQKNPMEVQAIRSKLNDMRKKLEDAGEFCAGRIKEEVEKAKANERKSCVEQVNGVKKDYQDRLATANLEYERLLLKKAGDISSLTLLWVRLKKLFVRTDK